MALVFLLQQSFTIRRPSSLTRHCSFRVPPIDENSLLLPPVGVWAVSQSQCGIIALVSRYLTNQLMHRRLIRMRGLGPFSIPKMPSGCSSCISCRFQPLSTTYGQIAHVLLTRSPLGLRKQASFRLVRLACIRHAASVHPEPGSNSPFAHSFTLSRLFSFLRFLYSVFIGIDVSCSVFKDRPPRLVYITILSFLRQHFFSLFFVS